MKKSSRKGIPFGKIKYDDEDKYYLVRIVNFQNLNSSDIIIDYSRPNIFNVKSADLFLDFSEKHIYTAPLPYENIYTHTNNRNIQSLTTFINTNIPRRKKLLDDMKEYSNNHCNISNCFNEKLQDLYKNTKILINIHQNDLYNTFEELRCLPALQNGVIIISESSPLNHLIPYNNLIIWCDYNNIIDKTEEVLKNYNEYHNKIFTEDNINILTNMGLENKTTMETALLSAINNKNTCENVAII